MERVDFYSVMKVIRDNYKSGYEPTQISLVGDLFCTYRDETGSEFEGTQACRWLSGQMPVSSNVGLYYTLDKKKKRSLMVDILGYVIPDIHDIEKTGEELKDIVIQDSSISESKKQGIIFDDRITTGEELAEYIATLILFTLERPFIKRDKKTKELLMNGTLSPAVMDYIYMEDIPEPCKHFMGRDKELAELGRLLENEKKVFVRGIAGIGKSELVRAYIKENKKKYTNIIYISYTGSLYKDIAELDFADDRFDEYEQAKFKRHNRFLRSLKEDTLIVIDGFDTLPHEDELFSVIYKYRCQIIFTTRSLFEGYPSMELSEIDDADMLMGLVSYFYKDASEYRDTILEIIETVHRHTLAVELAARLLSRGILEPDELLDRLKNENVKLQARDKLDLNKDGVPTKDTYYGHIHTLFSLYKLGKIQTSMMRCLTLVPPSGTSVKVFAHWMGAENMNDIRDLIDAGFVKEESANHICLQPMIRDIATADTEPAVSSCRTFLDNIEADMNEFEEVPYFHMLFAVMREIPYRIEVDDAERFYGFLSSCFLKYGEYRYPDEQWEILDRMENLMAEEKFANSVMRATLLSYQGHKEECDGKLEDALKLKMEALDIVKNEQDEQSMVCSLYSDISHLYNRLDRIGDAKRYGKKAETILGKIKEPDVRTFIGVRTHSAYTICQDMAHGRSIDTIEHTKRELEKRGLLGKKANAYLEEAEGLIYLNLFDYKEAEVHFDNARFAYADIWNADPELVEVREQEMKMRFPAAGMNIGKQLVKEGIYPILLTRGSSSKK